MTLEGRDGSGTTYQREDGSRCSRERPEGTQSYRREDRARPRWRHRAGLKATAFDMMRTRFWVWFGPIVLADLVGHLLDVRLLKYVTKPMLVPALLLFLILNTRNAVNASVRLVMAGLILSRIARMLEGTSFANPTLQPYVTEAVAMFSALKAAGKLDLVDNLVEMEDGRGFGEMLKPLEDLCSRIVEAYNACDLEAISRLRKEHADLSHADVRAMRDVVDAGLAAGK